MTTSAVSGHWRYHSARAEGSGFDADLQDKRTWRADWSIRVRDAVSALRGETYRRHSIAVNRAWPHGPIRAALEITPTQALAVHHANTILAHYDMRAHAHIVDDRAARVRVESQQIAHQMA